MGDWQLGIDFGTAYTVGAVYDHGRVSVLDIEANGQSRIPSVAFRTTGGEILVGAKALHQAVFAPERFEPSPKRVITHGEVFLGDEFVPVADLIAAVLRKVYTEACRQHREEVPAATRVTHPAEWADARTNILRSAIEASGLPHVELVPEPVAAAAWIAMAATTPGQHIAVYDFGGGTFDAAVLMRTATGFEVAGPPSGRDPLGGEDLDRKLIDYVGELVGDEFPEAWEKLSKPPDAAWRRHAAALRTEVQRAKETLTDVLSCQLWVSGIEKELQITRSELEELIAPDIAETVRSLSEAISAAGLEPGQLDGIYLVGGSSRIPLVADTIWRELGIRPAVQDNPKSVVAMGAAAWGSPLHHEAAGGADRTGLSTTIAGAINRAGLDASEFRTQLVMVRGTGDEDRGSLYMGWLVLEPVGGDGAGPVVVRDEPSWGRDSEALGRWARSVRSTSEPGFEELGFARSVVLGGHEGMELRYAKYAQGASSERSEYFDWLVATDDRAVFASGSESSRSVARGIELRRRSLAEASFFEMAFSLPVPPGWTVSEKVVYLQGPTQHQVVAEHLIVPGGTTQLQWRERRVRALLSRTTDGSIESTVSARVLGQLEGESVVIRWHEGRTRQLTKMWLAVLDEIHCYVVTVTLREKFRAKLDLLSEVVLLDPEVGAATETVAMGV